jgi:hypothetical protein
MVLRNKATTPEGNTDFESDVQSPQLIPTDLELTVANIVGSMDYRYSYHGPTKLLTCLVE